MRNQRLLWQIYPTQLIITITALLALTWFGSQAFRAFNLEQAADGLAARAHLAENSVLALLTAGNIAELNAFCRTVGATANTRLTVITPNGLVLADSLEEPTRMENHEDRPEVQAALAGKSSPSTRFSYTLQKNMMYMAIPLSSQGKIIGVLRTSIPITAIDNALAEIYRKILFFLIGVAITVALISWIISRRITTPLEKIRQVAVRFADGDFSRRLPEEGSAEVASLASAMNKMANQLDERIGTIVRQHHELAAVFSSMVEGVITVDNNERILSINLAGARLLGVNPDAIKGKNTLEAVRNIELQRFVSRAITSPATIESEITITDNNGRECYFYAHGTRLLDASQKGQGALIVINDLTNLRRLEKVRRDFVANVSHELKTPITSIEGFAETLLDGALDDPDNARRFLEIISKQAKRLHAIIEDLLALSRIEQEAENNEILLQDLTIKETLETAVHACRPKAMQKNITLNLNCPNQITARINPALLEQAIINLIDNGVKYSPQDSKIEVIAEQSAAETVIMIKDNGVGINKDDLPRIFERFYRVDKARSNKLGSTGLGLAIVKHITQAHHGTIEVDSNTGQGSTFTIHLPGGDKK
ncbi:MAG: ATP-binding protein [Desulfobulbaceae bacterium]|nr:ATP-binding protein [Desulfobulbaceae bacterium]HIJ78777.1 HAMP domain-containing protein [Deltaproteobacteria bacterium]